MRRYFTILLGVLIFSTLIYGISRITYQVNPVGCTLCGSCISSCPNNAIVADDEIGCFRIDQSLCDGCGTCLGSCPRNAIYVADGRSFLFGRVTNSETNFYIGYATVQVDTLSVTCDRFGNYFFTLNEGIYTLNCSADGFQSVQHSDIALASDDAYRLNIVLTPSTGNSTNAVGSQASKLNCYPNPSYNGTNIEIQLKEKVTDNLELEIFNLLGKRVRSLPMESTVFWDGLDSKGEQVPSGVYICSVRNGSEVLKKKLIIMK
ncbi:MAG: 4Fe-4S binding protein [Candidatus Cloacimonetes bacterium]|nr:4Fe-4S binding protein [Candidatus Cloacimonadota bacterium]